MAILEGPKNSSKKIRDQKWQIKPCPMTLPLPMNTVDEDENDDDGPVDDQFDTGCIHQDNDMDAAGAEDIDQIDVGVDYDD